MKADRSGSFAGFRFSFTGNFFTGKILLLGLALAQIIAAAHVYLSNTRLFHSLESIINAGYLPVPNENVMKSLLDLGPAFYGGLFFTLTTGALLSLLGLASALIWVRFFKRRKILLIPFLILWAGLIGEVNIKGLLPSETAYFLFIPSTVFMLASRWMPSVHNNKTGFIYGLLRIIPAVLIAILWALQINSGLFTDIRDYLLLSNSAGIRVNDFYYRYTMYPAEAIKSLDQKIMNTYRPDNISNDSLSDRIRKRLISHDFLEVNENAAFELIIDRQNSNLIFRNNGEIILQTSIQNFLSKTESILKELSSQMDRQDFFRSFTYISLSTGFPAAMIILFYSLVGVFLNLFLDYRKAGTTSLLLCLAAAILLSAFFFQVSGKQVKEENLTAALESDRWQDRVTALKIIDEKKMDIYRFGNYGEMLQSPHIPVRYWLARVLGESSSTDSQKDLLILMDDPSPNVVCMAYYSTGQRGDKRSIKELIKRINMSDHWYEQWYAYKALRALGWKQTK